MRFDMRILLLSPLLLLPGDAIIIHPDVPDSKYIADVTKWPFFVSLDQRGSCGGALISESGASEKNPKFSYVATAAHCLCADGERRSDVSIIFYDGSKATVSGNSIFFNPNCLFSCADDGPNKCDVAVIKLPASDVPSKASALDVYQWNDEVGKTIDTFGYGTTGNAAKLKTASLCNEAIGSDLDGKFRHGQNVVTGVSTGLLLYKMDCNDPPPRPTEALSGSGDSGGPAIITRDDQQFLAGVNSGNNEDNECDCGTVDQYNRLSDSYDNFIAPLLNGGDLSGCAILSDSDCEDSAALVRFAFIPGLLLLVLLRF